MSGLLLAVLLAAPVPAQSTLERGPTLDGTWVSQAGVGHFHILHRFWVTDPPARKVINTPTFVLGVGVGSGVLAGFRYASSSSLIPGEFNEWELFGRWRPVTERSTGVVDGALSAGWNNVAESVDGEVSIARAMGPVRFQLSARAFSAFAGGDADAAFGGGVVWRIGRNAALAGDVMTLASTDTTAAWSVGLQLRIPTTPHTVSLHTTNVNATTLQSASLGGGQQLYGFEFTVPVTFSRYFGGGGGLEPAPQVREGPAPADTAVVGMDNRLRFLPDTIRIRTGDAVRWENTSDIVHTVTADPAMAALESSVALPASAEPFNSGDLGPGQAYTRVFDVPGSYTYFCIPHERAGMVGVVIVERNGRGGRR